MFNFIKNLFTPKFYTGVADDFRFESEKQKDWLHEEITMGPVFSVWGKKEDVKKPYPFENQNATESCVAHAATLAMGIDNELEGNGYVRLSKTFPYRLRSNYPGGGMIMADMGDIAKDYGSCPFDELPTPSTEYEINQKTITQKNKDHAFPYKAKNFVQIQNCNSIETLNSVASQGKGVVIFIYATRNEWARQYPQVLDNVSLPNAPIRHGVCILPHSGFIENGVKYVTIQDSVSEWGTQIRYLSEDFISKRVYGAMYFINLKNEVIDTKPKHIFTTRMRYGDNNEEVSWLQKCLAYEGLFIGQPTGYFGGITLKAVNDFQNKYASEILAPNGLFQPTGYVGDATLRKLNQIYN